MSTHSRRTAIRAIEGPPSTTSSRRSKSYYSENHRSTPGAQELVTYQRPPSNASRSSRRPRPSPTTVLQRTSPADFPLPRSARKIPLPSIKPGSRISVTITSPEETTTSSRDPYRGDSAPVYTKRTTETYVFSPRNNGPKDYSLPPSRQPSQFSPRSHRPHRTVRMPSYSAESGYKSTYVRRPERLAPSRPERTYVSSRTTSTPRSSASVSTPRPVSQRALEQASLDFDDAETLAPSDSISQASGKARRRQRSAKSTSRYMSS